MHLKSSDQKVHLVSAAAKIGKFSWPDLQDEVVHDDVVADGDDVGVALLPLSLPPSPPRHGEGVSPDHVIDLPFCWSQDEVRHHHGDYVHLCDSLSCSRTSSFFSSFSAFLVCLYYLFGKSLTLLAARCDVTSEFQNVFDHGANLP